MLFIIEASTSTLILALYNDGVRAPMIPFMLSQIMMTITVIIGYFFESKAYMAKSYPAIGITALGLGLSFYLIHLTGLGDFRRVKHLGKYRVGFREFHTSKN